MERSNSRSFVSVDRGENFGVLGRNPMVPTSHEFSVSRIRTVMEFRSRIVIAIGHKFVISERVRVVIVSITNHRGYSMISKRDRRRRDSQVVQYGIAYENCIDKIVEEVCLSSELKSSHHSDHQNDGDISRTGIRTLLAISNASSDWLAPWIVDIGRTNSNPESFRHMGIHHKRNRTSGIKH